MVSAVLTTPAPAQAQSSAAQQLAERYSPVVAFHPQDKRCGTGEAYRPTLVDLVLGNQEVLLRDSDGHVVKRGPVAADLIGAPNTRYLDMPGDPLSPGCDYEKDFRRWSGNRKPATYAHVATDSDHQGKLAVQYWLYYAFNDFTNKHETSQARSSTHSPSPMRRSR